VSRGPCRRGKDDAIARSGAWRERVEHLAPAQPRHAQIADDQIEWLHQRAFNAWLRRGPTHFVTQLSSVACMYGECEARHHNEYRRFRAVRRAGSLSAPRARGLAPRAHCRQLDRERRAAAAAAPRDSPRCYAVFLDDARKWRARPSFAFGFVLKNGSNTRCARLGYPVRCRRC